MDSALAGFDEQETGGGLPGTRVPRVSGTQMHDEERLRIAAFRLREAANGIAALAGRAQEPAVRKSLLAIHERLLKEERELRAPKR